MLKSATTAGCLAASLLGTHVAAEPVKAKIDSGVIVGVAEGGVAAFKGVPFAAPPVGPLRWRPPQTATAWSGERSALAYGPACPQPTRPDHPNGGGYVGAVSEDCLTANVFAPAHAKNAPVMVWIYGGANVYGANSLSSYDGSAFARDGVILVSVNYRLGALGFFALPALTKVAPVDEPLGDYALMDQIAALKWVQRNIRSFGGDPKNVTVFGESAGGIDTLALMSTPSARGLFAKAIVESGAGWDKPITLAAAEKEGETLANKLAPGADLAGLRALPADKIVAEGGRYGPIVDGRLMPEDTTTAFARGHAADVPLIIGSNSFEASLLAAFHVPPEGYVALQPDGVKAAYADLPDMRAKANAMFTDGVMGGPARWIAARESSGAPAWLYYFSFRRAVYRDYLPGAPHASEIPFVFDSWDKLDASGLSRGPATPEDRAVTRVMHACWVAFAKTSAPNCPTPQPWPAYTPARDQLMDFGDQAAVKTHFKKTQLDAQEAAKAGQLSGR